METVTNHPRLQVKINDRGIAALAYNVLLREGVTVGLGGSFDTQKLDQATHKVWNPSSSAHQQRRKTNSCHRLVPASPLRAKYRRPQLCIFKHLFFDGEPLKMPLL